MITILLKKGFNICLNKRECYKQWSTENASEKMKVDLMLVKMQAESQREQCLL